MKNIMYYKNYWATINYSSEDEVFYGKIEGINDLVNFEGESVKELKKSFEDAVNDYISFCEEIGKDPQKPYKGNFNIRINPELHRELAIRAMKEGTSLNNYIEKKLSELCLCKN
jgi:predicted HicB family RNase H-like nuclease